MKRVIFIIISIAAIGLFLIGMKPKISPLVSSFDKDGYVTFSGNGVNLLFDTGANITLLYTDTVPESFYPLDMIDRCNWLIDFTKGEISNVHPFVPGTPDMVLRYKKERGLYYVEEMELNGVKCSHVLIDTGYDRSDFFLSKQDIEQMSDACFLKKDTCYGFADTGNEISIYEVAQGEVNKMQFKNVTLATLASRRTMGISFFKRFSQVVLDTRKQEIRCYCLNE